MVISGSGAAASHRPAHIMAAASSSSSSMAKRAAATQTTLPDFSLPVLKNWGSQRILRCMKLKGQSADTQVDGAGPDNVSAAKSTTTTTTGDDGLDRVRAKLMDHLRKAADKIDLAVPHRGGGAEEEQAPVTDVPWKLRTRRGSYSRQAGAGLPGSSSQQLGRSSRPRSEELDRQEVTGMSRRRKFSVALSMEEVDEDLYSLTGKRASRRPKKRPRAIRNQLDQLFPGYYLSEVTPDNYEVREPPPPPAVES